ncbi:hypothetical protein TNIN_383391 [Trichonephila inaurata madagascariensis]|uniref:Uncharacterized protein n=1 Tax=Trichonephila inaurata madagascariensis TaxID=2747483 RepID=A0A8X6XGB6_9ARAC|nr:hypothetical protein TNIN_383391 [Trichonephila inaurata madagascariensis]
MGCFFILLRASCKDRCLSERSYRSEGMHTVIGWNGQLKILIRNRVLLERRRVDCFGTIGEGSVYLRGEMRRSTYLQYRDVSSMKSVNGLTPPQRLFILAMTIINQE